MKIYKSQQHETIQVKGLCNTYQQLYTIWQFNSHTLSNQIKQRKNQNKRLFAKKQLKILIASSVKGLAALQSYNRLHSKLTTSAIKLNESSKIIKIVDPLSMSQKQNFYRVYEFNQSSGIYISPEQCDALKINTPCVKSNKNDVFALGMIFLQTGLLQDLSQCYLEDFRKIDWVKLHKKLADFQKIYGSNIGGLIRCMLEQNKKDRPSWAKLKYALNSTSKRSSNSTTQLNEVLNSQTRFSPDVLPYSIRPQHSLIYSFKDSIRPQSIQPNVLNYSTQNEKIAIQQKVQPTINTLINKQNQSIKVNQNKPYNSNIKTRLPTQVIFSNIGIRQNQSIFQHQISLHPLLLQPKSIVSHVMTINPRGLKKFVSPNSCQGILFQQKDITSKQIAQKIQPIKSLQPNIYNLPGQVSIPNTLQNIKPRVIHQMRQQAPTSLKYQDKQNKLSSNNVIKRAVSFTYELKQEVKSKQLKQKSQKMQQDQRQTQKNQPTEQVQYIKQKFSVGSRYEGYKLKNMRHGQGRFYYQDGGLYDGEWQYNKMSGKGKLYYQSGSLAYDGLWKDDQFQGKGKLCNQSPQQLAQAYPYTNFDGVGQYWVFYEGDFKNDMKEGRGKLMLKNGQYYSGDFKQDMITGIGKFYTQTGNVIKGNWQNNKLIKIL